MIHQIYIRTTEHTKRFDVINACLLFWPGSKISECKREADISVHSSIRTVEPNKVRATATVCINGQKYTAQRTAPIYAEEDMLLPIKQTVFLAAQKATGITPPWGILTGIRPMSVYEKLYRKFGAKAEQILINKYFLSPEKASILRSIFAAREPVYYDGVEHDVSMYISIPFCPSKCSYCSFVSSAVERVKHLVEPYLDLLIYEIKEKIKIVQDAGKIIATVYVGGGTPGVLTEEQIERLMSVLHQNVQNPLLEFCFEIGRPETITDEKLAILKRYGVNRLCINCQTLNDSVLSAIGRRHTAEQFLSAVKMAQPYGFDSINVDYIAGLPDETVQSHITSVQKAIELSTENITIHTLSIKKASTWQQTDEMYDPASDRVAAMLTKGYELLKENGYLPYYIYRQKSTVSNGENIGYAKKGHIGRYNIYMMEDVHSVIGCGAGASTKIIHGDSGRIDRFMNTKYPQEYIKFTDKLHENIQSIKDNLKG